MEILLLALPAFMVPSLEPACRSLLAQICATTELIIATHQSTAKRVRQWLEDFQLIQRCQLIIIDNNIPLSMWVQDDFHVIRHPDGTPGLLISQQAKPHVHSLLRQIADVTGMALTNVEYAPDGGNILAGKDRILIGGNDCYGKDTKKLPDFVSENFLSIACPNKTSSELKQPLLLGGEEWEEVFHFGNKTNTCQPVFHIDIFLSLAGRRQDGRPRVLVGDPGMAARFLDCAPHDHCSQSAFDDIADQLKAEGFDVVRNPLPLVYCDNEGSRERQWYFSSSNNAIVQDCSTYGRIVWLPTFGHGNWPELAATDAANINIWKNLGFDVRPIANCQPLAENLGGLRCFTKTWTQSMA